MVQCRHFVQALRKIKIRYVLIMNLEINLHYLTPSNIHYLKIY